MMTRYIPEGTVVRAKKSYVIDHEGIVLYERGELKVIHNSPRLGVVAITSLEEFCAGKEFEVIEYETCIPLWRRAENARALIGKRWSLFHYNCQHFVAEALGKELSSYQLNQLAFLLLGAVIFVMAKSK